MPGRPGRRRMLMRMRELGKAQGKNGIQWLLDEVANGRTMLSLCDELNTSKWELYAWLNKSDRRKEAYQVAKRLRAIHRIEEAFKRAMGPYTEDGTYDGEHDSKVRVARDTLVLNATRMFAMADDPDTFGKKSETRHTVAGSVEVLHLDALRAANAEVQQLTNRFEKADEHALPPGYRKKEILPPIDVEAKVVEETEDD